jgi:ATP-dependent Lon protease
MESRSLVPQSSPFHLPVAQMRRVFQPDEVERKLAKLQGNEHELPAQPPTIACWSAAHERFQVKPSGVPEMGEPLHICSPTSPKCWMT